MKKLKVIFYSYSDILKREFTNIEYHNSLSDAKLRAAALGWTIQNIEEVQ